MLFGFSFCRGSIRASSGNQAWRSLWSSLWATDASFLSSNSTKWVSITRKNEQTEKTEDPTFYNSSSKSCFCSLGSNFLDDGESDFGRSSFYGNWQLSMTSSVFFFMLFCICNHFLFSIQFTILTWLSNLSYETSSFPFLLLFSFFRKRTEFGSLRIYDGMVEITYG